MENKRSKQLKKAISGRIRELLVEKKMTQAKLAEAIGTPPPNMSRLLAGQVNLTLETIAAMEQALGEDVIQVTGRKK